MNTGEHGWTDADRVVVAASLGRVPVGVIGVVARRPGGSPTVIMNSPLQHEPGGCVPFPTLYWLVDPVLNTLISDIERQGAVREIESVLAADDALMKQHLADNDAYAKSRWACMNIEDEDDAERQGLTMVLMTSGIGGVANHASVKCLHAQYAYHLARLAARKNGTTVGRLMDERYGTRLSL